MSSFDFSYNATIKLTALPRCRAQACFPGVSDLVVNSRVFQTDVECVNSAKGLFEDLIMDVNSQNKDIQLMISAELNPLNTGIETRSRDWEEQELARLWIFDKRQEGSDRIHALGQARIFKSYRIEPAPFLN